MSAELPVFSSLKLKPSASAAIQRRSTSVSSIVRAPGSAKTNGSPISSCAAARRGNSQRRSARPIASVSEWKRESMPIFAMRAVSASTLSSCAPALRKAMLVGISATRDAVAASVRSALARRAGYFMSAGIGARLLAISRSVSLVLARSTSLDTACPAQPPAWSPARPRNTLVSGRSRSLNAVTAADQAQEALRLIDPFPRYARSEFGRGPSIGSLDESAKFPRSRRRSYRPPKSHELASSPLRATMQAKRASGRDFGGFLHEHEVSNWVSNWLPDWLPEGRSRTIRRYPRGPASVPPPVPPPTASATSIPSPPNRRSRAPNARIARWKSARAKSGQSTSVT